MRKNNLVAVFLVGLVFSGCAPLLVAGGVAGGYALAKDLQDGKLIDSVDARGVQRTTLTSWTVIGEVMSIDRTSNEVVVREDDGATTRFSFAHIGPSLQVGDRIEVKVENQKVISLGTQRT